MLPIKRSWGYEKSQLHLLYLRDELLKQDNQEVTWKRIMTLYFFSHCLALTQFGKGISPKNFYAGETPELYFDKLPQALCGRQTKNSFRRYENRYRRKLKKQFPDRAFKWAIDYDSNKWRLV